MQWKGGKIENQNTIFLLPSPEVPFPCHRIRVTHALIRILHGSAWLKKAKGQHWGWEIRV